MHDQEDVARLLERPAFTRFGRSVVIDAAGRPTGLVSITDYSARYAPTASPYSQGSGG